MDDLQNKNLHELAFLKDRLQAAHDSCGDVCELGRSPFGTSEEALKAEYRERIAAVDAEIAKRRTEMRERNIQALDNAITLLNEFAATTENILYREQSPERNAKQLARLEEAERELQRMRREIHSID